MTNDNPIGIFDSGVGGLTVVKSLIKSLPGESFIYFGDTAHVPYGNKSREQLLSYAQSIIDFLISKKAKAIVVACGTHSSVTLPEIETNYQLPILGVVKAAARSVNKISRGLRIGVLATQATVNSKAYTKAIKAINPACQVFEAACPRFVPLVESGKLNTDETREAVAEYLKPLMDKEIDSLVLGCTHYPFLTKAIREYTGSAVELVNPSRETIAELKEKLTAYDLCNGSGREPFKEFYVSGNDKSFYEVGTLLLGDTIKAVQHMELDFN